MPSNTLDSTDILKANGTLKITGPVVREASNVECFDVRSIVKHTTDAFCTFTDDTPDMLPLGISDYDREIGCLTPGQVAAIGARTGVGKTSTCVLVGLTAAARHHTPIGMISLEDSSALIGGKVINALLQIDDLKLRRKKLLPREVASLTEFLGKTSNIPFHIADIKKRGIDHVLDAMYTLHRIGCRVIYVDYLQSISKPQPYQGESSALLLFMEAFQDIARELNICPVVVSQVNRPGKYFDYDTKSYLPDLRPPIISDMKGAAEIENTSKFITLLWSEGGYTRAVVRKDSYGDLVDKEVKFIRQGGILRKV